MDPRPLKPAKPRKKHPELPVQKTGESAPAARSVPVGRMEAAAPASAPAAPAACRTPGERARFWIYTPVLLAILAMLPRLASPEFGLLDDAVTLLNARGLASDPLLSLRMSAEHGRFVPGYWLSYAFIHLFAGENPLFFFLANTAVFGLITALLIRFVRQRGGTSLQAWAAGILFVLSGSAVEVFYTLSKAEGFQTLWLLAGMLILAVFPGNTRGRSLFSAAAAGLLFFLASVTKETSIVVAPIALAWLLAGRWFERPRSDSMDGAVRRRFLAAAVAAVAAALILRRMFIVVAEGNYASRYRLDLGQLTQSLLAWCGFFARDCAYLLPLLAVFAWGLFRGRKPPHAALLAEALIWMMGWVAVFLPWHSTVHYYVLPFALGAALAGGVLFGAATEFVRSERGALRFAAAGALGMALWLVQFQVPNNWTTARIQVALDTANADLVRYVTNLPAGATIFVNTAEHHEYFYELKLYSNLRGRPDLSIRPFTGQIPASGGEVYVASPFMENQPAHAVRCSVSEDYTRDLAVGLQSLPAERLQLVREPQQEVALLDVGMDRLVLSWLGKWGDPRRWPVVEGRTFRYGWRVYRVSGSPKPARPGLFSNGLWRLQTGEGKTVEISFGREGDVPVTGDWDGDGSTDVGVYRPSDRTWYLNQDGDPEPEFRIRLAGMLPGDQPVTGDWDGNGSSALGFYRPSDGTWRLRNSLTSGAEDWPVFQFGGPGRVALSGDWNGDGRDSPGVYDARSGNVYLANRLKSGPEDIAFSIAPHAVAVPANWAGWGAASLAVVEGGRWSLRLVNSNSHISNMAPPLEVKGGGVPVAGNWR